MHPWKTTARLLVLTFAALLLHGYHPYAEDAEIYLPAVEKQLHPELFPLRAEFFETQGSLTGFPRLLAATIRLSHLPFDYALFLWHVASIFLLLLAARQLASQLFAGERARWGAVALLAALLTLPVAGTALYIMDQYVNPRNLATFAAVFAAARTLDGKLIRAALWTAFALAVHPLMGWFALSFCVLWLVIERIDERRRKPAYEPSLVGFLLPGLLYPTSEAYHQAARLHGFHYVLNWAWYEWLGAIAPAVIFWWLGRIAYRSKLVKLWRTCRALTIYDVTYFAAAFVVSVPRQFETLARIQPLRCLQLLYIILILVAGAFLAESVLNRRVWRWILLFLPLSAGMYWAQRSLFRSSAHIEWPWAEPHNRWAQAFLWIRSNTPTDALFAMDPLYITIPGEDTVAFRPLAERSSLADGYKDSGTVSMFPPLAELWWEQFQAQRNWKNFGVQDFARLRARYQVSWVVLQAPGLAGLACPYRNSEVAVCRLSY